MALGTVKWFNDAKGYGFISRQDDGKDVFVHYSSISGEGFRTLIQGQTVEYDEAHGPKGLFAAKVLKVIEAAAPS
jgi:CspA family cold shock protein